MNAPHDIPRASRLKTLFSPATVDIFAGCGGWSIGAEQAYADAGLLDRYIDLMINHWDVAVGVHQVNHPLTQHLRANVLEVDPDAVLKGRQIIHLHASPDCTDHSKAKGGKPRRKEIRALADVVIVWAAKRRPTVITLENVEEFEQWGPLLPDGQPDKTRRGDEFRRWEGELRALGYEVEHRVLRACDYGAPTTRKRLFVVARCDGRPIAWPEKTHGSRAVAGSVVRPVDRSLHRSKTQPNLHPADPVLRHSDRVLKPFRTAAECVDWSIPMLSIFATPEEAKAFAVQHHCGVPRRPLKPKTLARIAGGLDKYVVRAAKPFIVDIQNYGWNGNETRDVAQPMPTVAAGPKGGGFAVVDGKLAPYTVPNLGEREGQSPRCRSVEQPMPTVTGKANGARLVAANLVRCAHGDHSDGGARWGQTAHDVEQPLGTVTGSKDYAVAAVHLATLNPGGEQHRRADAHRPLATVTGANDARGLVAAMLTKHCGGVLGHGVDIPASTVTGVDHHAVTCAYLSHHYGNNKGSGGDPDRPAATITGSSNHAAVMTASAVPFLVGTGGASYAAKPKSADEPANTVMVNDRRAIVAAFLAAYYGEGSGKVGHGVADPLPAATGHARFGLVTVVIDGQTYVITDIAMRMLTPRELARAQGFDDSYVIDRTAEGKPVTKADQVKLIGNAVPPAFARAIVKSNIIDQGMIRPAKRERRRRKAVLA